MVPHGITYIHIMKITIINNSIITMSSSNRHVFILCLKHAPTKRICQCNYASVLIGYVKYVAVTKNVNISGTRNKYPGC